MGTEDDVKAHEATCDHNFNNKGCMTCKNCKTDGIRQLQCGKGKEIPEGKQFLHCDDHERGEPELVGIMNMFMNVFKEKQNESKTTD
jgi:hypothetical protein